jgi:hypothetical protein
MQYTTEAESKARLVEAQRRRNEAYGLIEVIKDGRRYFTCRHKETGLSFQAMDVKVEAKRLS